MRLLKVGIVIFSVILGIGIIGTGASLGNLYKTSQLTYETSLEEKLDITALNNIDIKSDVPLRIQMTTGEPMVTFESFTRGLIIPEPDYAIKVRTQGDSSYIEVKDENYQFMNLSFGGHAKQAVLYLPEQAINKLKITTNSYQRVEFEGKADIKEILVEGGSVTLNLEGDLGKVELNADNVELGLVSYTPATVEVQAHYGEVELEGKYTDVVINGFSNGEIKVDSDNRYKVDVSTSNSNIRLNGNIEIAEVYSGDNGKIDIQATTQPKYIDIESYYGNVNVKLPADITGFTGTYEYEIDEQGLFSNFDITTQTIGEYTKKLQYGDGATQIRLNVYEADTSIIK